MGFASYGVISYGIEEKDMETTTSVLELYWGLFWGITLYLEGDCKSNYGPLQDFTVEGAPPHHCFDNPFHFHASAGDSSSCCVARRGFRK